MKQRILNFLDLFILLNRLELFGILLFPKLSNVLS